MLLPVVHPFVGNNAKRYSGSIIMLNLISLNALTWHAQLLLVLCLKIILTFST